MLGLGYPGGPVIDRLAKEGDPKRFQFPEPQIDGLDFSFSGLKTSVLYFLQRETAADPDFARNNLNDICASVQHRIVTILLKKLRLAARKYRIREIAVAGGVSANSFLRTALDETGRELNWNTYIPQFQYCTDNAAMIAMAGYFRFIEGRFDGLELHPDARLRFS